MTNKILFLILILGVTRLSAQSIYNVETDIVSYQNLTGSTSLSNGDVWDDPAYTIPIGFDFSISSFTFNTIYIVGWGLGGDLSSNPNDNGILPIFVPIGLDLVSRIDTNGNSVSPISYKVDGVAGSQILKIEWNNVGFFDDSSENDFMNIQMWLYEESNIIEYHYGPYVINNPDETFEGETGPFVSLFTSYNMNTDELEDNAYILSGDPANPTVILYEPGDDGDGVLIGAIPDGTVYRFIPEILSINHLEKTRFTLYPNPTNNNLNIETTAINYSIKLYDILGNQVGDYPNNPNGINVSYLVKGVYLIIIETSEGNTVRKFIKN